MRQSFADTEEELAKMENFDAQYHLNFLGVHPDYQRRGIGAKIVRYGVEKAKEEGIPCSLEASRAGKKVYVNCGFREIGTCDPFHGKEWKEGMHCREEGCDFAAGSFMVWEPGVDG